MTNLMAGIVYVRRDGERTSRLQASDEEKDKPFWDVKFGVSYTAKGYRNQSEIEHPADLVSIYRKESVADKLAQLKDQEKESLPADSFPDIVSFPIQGDVYVLMSWHADFSGFFFEGVFTSEAEARQLEQFSNSISPLRRVGVFKMPLNRLHNQEIGR